MGSVNSVCVTVCGGGLGEARKEKNIDREEETVGETGPRLDQKQRDQEHRGANSA